MIYLDSSAIVKLVRREPESGALIAYLRDQSERVSSVIAAVEVPRAIRAGTTAAPIVRRMQGVLARIGLIELGVSVVARAAELEPFAVRTLDAIHIASALDVGDAVTAFVTYDRRQGSAAIATGTEVVSPGV